MQSRATFLACNIFLTYFTFCHGNHTYCKNKRPHSPLTGDNLDEMIIMLGRDPRNPCTYLEGNLVINGFLSKERPNADATYTAAQALFNSLRVVTGYVAITAYARSELTFNNLQVIRGQQLYRHDDQRDYGLFVFDLISHQRTLAFPNLTVIKQGSVRFLKIRSRTVCGMAHRFDWRELWENPETQNIFIQCDLEGNLNWTAPKCHKSCERNLDNGTTATCWSSAASHCQIRSKCRERLCNRCYVDHEGREECCHEECIGGCTGPGPEHCRGCQHKIHNETCVASCPTGTFELSQICLEQCPEMYFIQDTYCVETCSVGYYLEERICKPCTRGQCASRCKLVDDADNHLSLNKQLLATLKNCTFLEGSVRADGFSFSRDPSTDITTAKEFDALSSLQEITGVVYLDFNKFQGGQPRSGFLRRLRKIGGFFRGGFRPKQSLMFVNYPGVTMGLQQLESVQGSRVGCFTCKNLQYGETVNWTRLGATGMDFINVPKPKSDACSPDCDPEWGCFGPGVEFCVRCRHWAAVGEDAASGEEQRRCVRDCSETGVHFTPAVSAGTESRVCGRCHPECARGCTGPGANECMNNECKHVMLDGGCAAACPRTTFQNGTQCIPCDPSCHPRRQSGEAVCYGTGVSACNKCHAVLLDRMGLPRCVDTRRSGNCPEGYYSRVESPLKSIQSSDWDTVAHFNEANEPMLICRPCTSPCRICSSAVECHQCDKVWFRGSCVDSCPTENMPMGYNETSLTSNSTCPACDVNCEGGCYGIEATQCKSCKSYHVVVLHTLAEMGTNLTKMCMASCPYEKPYVRPDGECSDVKPPQTVLALSLSSSLAFVFICALLLALFIWILFEKRRQHKYLRDKQRLQDFFTNGTELETLNRRTLSYKAPNLNRLQLMNADDLHLDEGQLLGSGAFGEVYKAEWTFTALQRASPGNGSRNVSTGSRPWNLGGGIGTQDYTGTTSLAGDSLFVDGTQTMGSLWSGSVKTDVFKKKHNITVAVKLINNDFVSDSQQRLQELLEEARVMASMNHDNCLPLIGICLSKGRQCLVTAFMPLGSMDKYIQSHKDDLDAYTLFLWGVQIAAGMGYLAKHGIIHRDLATRNVLLQHHHFVKITDFGLSKMLESDGEKEIVVRTGRVPIRWLALETLRWGVYSHATDVWAYGVTLWEIFSLGQVPYPGMDALQVRDHVLHGGTLSRPNGCHDAFYLEMSKCWLPEADLRPDFRTLYSKCLFFLECPDLYFSNCNVASSMSEPRAPQALSPSPGVQLTFRDTYADMSNTRPSTVASTHYRNGGSDRFFPGEKAPFLSTVSSAESPQDDYVGASDEWDGQMPTPVKSLDQVDSEMKRIPMVPSHVYEPLEGSARVSSVPHHPGESSEEDHPPLLSPSDQYC